MPCARPCALLRGPAFLMPLYHALKILSATNRWLKARFFLNINPHIYITLVGSCFPNQIPGCMIQTQKVGKKLHPFHWIPRTIGHDKVVGFLVNLIGGHASWCGIHHRMWPHPSITKSHQRGISNWNCDFLVMIFMGGKSVSIFTHFPLGDLTSAHPKISIFWFNWQLGAGLIWQQQLVL